MGGAIVTEGGGARPSSFPLDVDGGHYLCERGGGCS